MRYITPPENRTRTVRNSNLELLRIASMMLVVLVHYIPTRYSLSPESVRTDLWTSICEMELKSLCYVCVNCFVLISGYFGIKWRSKSFSKLIYTIILYSVIALFLGKWLSGYDDLPSLPANMGFAAETFTTRWFIGAYLCLYIIAPVLNAFIEKLSQKELGRFLLCFYAFSTVFGWFLKSDNFNEGMSELSLLGLYLTGAYLRKTDLKCFNMSGLSDLAVYFILGFLLVAVNTATYLAGIEKSIYGYLNPVVILQSIYLFLFFKKLKVGKIGWINLVAASAFSVYLLHHHNMVFPYYIWLCNWMNVNSPASLLSMVLVIAGLFVVCMAIDAVAMPLFNRVYGRLSHLVDKRTELYRQKN